MKEAQLKSQTKISGILMISSVVGFILIGLLLLGIRKIKRQNIDIKNKTEDLIKVNKDLERSNNDLERFAHIASHDLKSPINTMVSFAGLLKRKLKSINDEKSMEYLSFIENSGKRMRKLIEDILVYSKLSSKSSSKHEIINLNDVVNEIAELVNNKYKEKPINIAASSLPCLKWNYTKIFMLFKNLIENGLKYNDADIPQVKLHTIPFDKYTMIQIEDNGIGIPDKYFDEIFEMFNRLHSQDKYEGTGIGLATCKKIIEELGGVISVSSTINKGSIFKIKVSNELIVQKL